MDASAFQTLSAHAIEQTDPTDNDVLFAEVMTDDTISAVARVDALPALRRHRSLSGYGALQHV